MNLKNIPATQSIPNDISHMYVKIDYTFERGETHFIPIFSKFFYRDLSTNHLSTLHKDTFRGLTHLTSLDLSKNHLDFLPNDLLLDLDSLSNLWVVFSFTIYEKQSLID